MDSGRGSIGKKRCGGNMSSMKYEEHWRCEGIRAVSGKGVQCGRAVWAVWGGRQPGGALLATW